MKNIIFDFDGTLANTLPVVVDIAEGILGQEVSSTDIAKYRNMTIKSILKEARIPMYKIPGLLVKGRPLLQKRMSEVDLFDGLEGVIKELSADYSLYIVSSNGLGIITKFLENYKLKKYFKRIYGNVGIFSKAQAVKKVMKREGFSIGDALYVGDEVRDIEAAKKIGLPIISVTWGYNGDKILKSYNPEYLASRPTDIIKIING